MSALTDPTTGSPGGEHALLLGPDSLPAVLHRGAGTPRAAVLIIVGGPQYRVGSHRQFVLLARHLAANGCTVLRFDYGGMGDAGGEARTFENCGDHIRAACDRLLAEVPPGTKLVLWGLCDAASAIMMYASEDARVKGVVVANPWARNTATQAGTMLRSYYLRRLLSLDFWRKLLGGGVRVGESMGSLAQNVRDSSGTAEAGGFIDRMRSGVEKLHCPMLLIISDRDLTAAEFLLTVERSKPWQKALAALDISRESIAGADHTFSRRAWRDAAAVSTARWIEAL